MDPLQQLFMRAQSLKYKIDECNREIASAKEPELIQAHTTIKVTHVATLASVNTQLLSMVSTMTAASTS